jgi:hypothetical protein
MNVPANVLCAFLSESIQVLPLYFFVNQFELSFTQDLHCFPFEAVI